MVIYVTVGGAMGGHARVTDTTFGLPDAGGVRHQVLRPWCLALCSHSQPIVAVQEESG